MDVSTLLLGVIAVAVAAMAVVQVATLWYGMRLVRRLDRVATQVERDILPAVERFNEVSGDVARATSLAVAQIERADELFARFAGRADRLLAVGQDAIFEPIRRSAALLQALRTVLDTLRGGTSRRSAKSSAADDQEALFIG